MQMTAVSFWTCVVGAYLLHVVRQSHVLVNHFLLLCGEFLARGKQRA